LVRQILGVLLNKEENKITVAGNYDRIFFLNETIASKLYLKKSNGIFNNFFPYEQCPDCLCKSTNLYPITFTLLAFSAKIQQSTLWFLDAGIELKHRKNPAL